MSADGIELRFAVNYLAGVVIRHELTPELLVAGGHSGYHVVAPWRRQGHATRMLAAGLAEARAIGLARVLLTCDPDNEPSRRVITTNGGVPDEQLGAELRFWTDTTAPRACARLTYANAFDRGGRGGPTPFVSPSKRRATLIPLKVLEHEESART